MDFEIGAILDGKVSGITEFGAFVTLPGGRSGLVHISEVAYSYVSDVKDFLTVGQDVQVKVISVDANNRINLSIKQTLPPPPKPERPVRRGGERGGGRYDRPARSQGERDSRPHSAGRSGARPVSRGPQSFEDMMKKYMSESESRQSELNRGGRSSGRRGRRGGRGGGGSGPSYDF